MYRKWKKIAALGLAVLIGGMMPMSTMLAAEDNAAAEISSVSDNDVFSDDKNVDIEVVSETEEPETSDGEIPESAAAPVIDIRYQGQSSCYALGGGIDYRYINHQGEAFECSATQNGQAIGFYYYLDRVADVTAPAREEGALDVRWESWEQPYSSLRVPLSEDQIYVVYVKAAGKDGQTVYARSGGVVVDTIRPEIVGLNAGGTYPAGTSFRVTDANLESVKVNETAVTPESDGSYRVAANGTSCVIRAIDKAGNETTCSIIVSGDEKPGTGDETPGTGDEKPGTGDETPGTGDEKPGTGDETPGTGDEKPGTGDEKPETGKVISESGVYALKAGVKYHLAEGKWKVNGDKSVYQGDKDFYVKEDGNYKFKK